MAGLIEVYSTNVIVKVYSEGFHLKTGKIVSFKYNNLSSNYCIDVGRCVSPVCWCSITYSLICLETTCPIATWDYETKLKLFMINQNYQKFWLESKFWNSEFLRILEENLGYSRTMFWGRLLILNGMNFQKNLHSLFVSLIPSFPSRTNIFHKPNLSVNLQLLEKRLPIFTGSHNQFFVANC